MHRSHAQADLQQQRDQQRHAAAAHAREQVAEDADAEADHPEQMQREQRCRCIGRVQPVADQRGQAGDGQQHHARMAQPQLGDPVQRQRQRDHAERQHRVADQVEAGALLAVEIRHHLQRRDEADRADRQVDQEHPVPRGHLHQPPAERRPDQRPDQRGDGDEAHRVEELFARHRTHHRQASDRQQHRPADALQHARGDQVGQAWRGRAQQRAEGEQHDRGQEGAARAVAVGDPARGGDEHRHRQRIAEHHRLHLQRALAQAARHRRQRGVDDGCVQHLHEDGQRHQPQQRPETAVGRNGDRIGRRRGHRHARRREERTGSRSSRRGAVQ